AMRQRVRVHHHKSADDNGPRRAFIAGPRATVVSRGERGRIGLGAATRGKPSSGTATDSWVALAPLVASWGGVPPRRLLAVLVGDPTSRPDPHRTPRWGRGLLRYPGIGRMPMPAKTAGSLVWAPIDWEALT